jgi:hypothetical protein
MAQILVRRPSLGILVCAVAMMATPASAQLAVRPEMRSLPKVAPTMASTAQGELHGTVVDEQGEPLAGAIVSALGSATVFAVTDREGRYVFRNLAAGPYLVRAHLQGYLPARGRVLQVGAAGRISSRIVLAKSGGAGDAPPVIAAGVGGVEPVATSGETPHDHDEVAWRMRHGKRSVLKDAEWAVAELDDPSLFERSRGGVARAVSQSARLASELFSDLSLNGEINLLTTTSFNRPQDLFAMNVGAPRGVAYVSLATPSAHGEWTMQGTMTQGDLASWILAGSFVRRAPAAHAYEAGLSYSTQRYMGGNAEALAAMRDGSRNVASMFAYDTWTITPRLAVSYGGEYANYDYLADRGLLSPRVTVSVRPSPDAPSFVLRATVAHRERAPGAEEFETPAAGLWLPPERTFSHVARGAFTPERFDHVEVSGERRLPADVLIGVRAFRQTIDDQLVTLFDVSTLGDTPQVGHYQVGAAGDVAAHGWGVTVSRAVAEGVRASVDYTQTDAEWTGSGDARLLARLAPSIHRTSERIHDLTASVESVVAPTSTRFFVLYKLNSAFAAREVLDESPAASARFNMQVNQPLSFLNFSSTRWEMLVAVSNLFHRELADGSIYDELLVVRPPKRVLGGVTVKF